MSDEKQGRIEFTLPMSQKSAYVRAARASGKKLVTWMLDALDKEAGIEASKPAATQTLWDRFVQQAKTQRYEYPDDAKSLERVDSEYVRRRILVERAIIRQLVTDVLAARLADYPAYAVSVYYGDNDYGIEKSRDLNAIMEALGACDEEYLNFYTLDPAGKPVRSNGWVQLVYGNDGYDVIADYSASPEISAFVEGTNDLTDELEMGMRSFDE